MLTIESCIASFMDVHSTETRVTRDSQKCEKVTIVKYSVHVRRDVTHDSQKTVSETFEFVRSVDDEAMQYNVPEEEGDEGGEEEEGEGRRRVMPVLVTVNITAHRTQHTAHTTHSTHHTPHTSFLSSYWSTQQHNVTTHHYIPIVVQEVNVGPGEEGHVGERQLGLQGGEGRVEKKERERREG
jgi:hypothetical protein